MTTPRWSSGDPPLRATPPEAEGFVRVDRALEVDVVVVGSGPGGAACARALAKGGAKVLVLEEGPGRERFTRHYGGAMRHHMQEGGAMVAMGEATFPIAAGRGVGGGSLINSAIAWRAPKDILDRWQAQLDTDRYSHERLTSVYDELWALLGIWPTRVEIAGRNNDIVVAGVRALGLDGGYLERATPGCVGCGVCYFGCPSGGKASVNTNLLADAAAMGATLQADTRVDTFLLDGARCVGVSGQMIDPDTGEHGGRLTVRAGRVVLAAGGIGTPRTLHVAGLGQSLGPAVGRGLHVHPGNAVLGVCDEPVHLWRGATQGAYFHAPGMEHVLPHTFSAPPEACLGVLRALGPDTKEAVRLLPYLCGMVVMVSDEGEGRVRAWPDGRARIDYAWHPGDVERIKQGMLWAARVLFAGGAREVFAPVRGTTRCTSAEQLYEQVKDRPVADFTMYAAHPMSTCRMGLDPETSVIRPDGRAHRMEGLYLADSSIFPTSLGVNPSLTTMAMGQRIGEGLVEAG